MNPNNLQKQHLYPSISEKIIRNTIFNTIGRFWGILVALILIPYIIHHIGVERYGIWAIVGVITGYFGLLDFGVGTSFVKYISEYYTKEDFKSLNQVVNTGFVFYSLFGGAIIVLGFLLVGLLLKFFNIPNKFYDEALFVFILGIIIFAVSNAVSAFGAIQGGLQRMDISNKVAIAVSIPMVIGTIYFLESGYGLSGLMVNNAIILVISSVVNVAIAFRILPELKFNPFSFNKKMFKKLFSFGIKVQVARVEDVFTFQTDKLLISHFLGIGLVTYYQLGGTIINKVRGLPLLLISAIVPAASELDAKEDKKKICDLYSRGTKYLAVAGIPLLAFVFLTAPLIMLIWMGEGYEKSVLVIQILAPCYLINFLTGMGTSIALGIGKPEFHMKAGAFQLILNIILSIILVIVIGFVGVVIATLVSLSLSSIWFMEMFHKHLRYSLLDFARKTFIFPLIISLFAGSIILSFNYAINLINLPSSRLLSLGILTTEAIIFITVYILAILKTNYLDNYDKNLIKERICLKQWKTNKIMTNK